MSTAATFTWHPMPTREGFETYQLRRNHEALVTLELNLFSQTAKVSSADSRRTFKIDKEGFLKNRTILKNEYGVKIGQLGLETWYSQEGFIELNGEKFYYAHGSNNHTELLIYKNNRNNPLFICSINITGTASVALHKNKEADTQSWLLMAICWFLFLPVARNTLPAQTGFAAATH
jgi:hypothetical protein